jgi:hypothetical protein
MAGFGIDCVETQLTAPRPKVNFVANCCKGPRTWPDSVELRIGTSGGLL